MVDVRTTQDFVGWLGGLRDLRARARIQIRIDRLELGNFGDAKFFDGIGEVRIDYGPGYRLYLMRRGNEVIILLCGGDKSTQRRDIAKALDLAKEVRDGT